MRTLKYALLGLLNQQSMSGYDITRQFKHALNEFWHAKHSQIYPELKKLTEEGLVTFEIANGENLMDKKIYTITDQGHQEFLQWLERDEEMEVTPKDVFRLRLFFSNNLPLEKRSALIKSQLKQHQDRLSYLRRNQDNYCGTVLSANSSEFGDYMVLLGAVMREEFIINWLSTCLEMCKPELCL